MSRKFKKNKITDVDRRIATNALTSISNFIEAGKIYHTITGHKETPIPIENISPNRGPGFKKEIIEILDMKVGSDKVKYYYMLMDMIKIVRSDKQRKPRMMRLLSKMNQRGSRQALSILGSSSTGLDVTRTKLKLAQAIDTKTSKDLLKILKAMELSHYLGSVRDLNVESLNKQIIRGKNGTWPTLMTQ